MSIAMNTLKFENFDKLIDGKPVKLYRLQNSHGLEAYITNYGASLVALYVPDRNGKPEDIVLGYDRLEDYIKGKSYFGATVGRCANRIDRAEFFLDRHPYRLTKNNGPHHLHGGAQGFSAKVWQTANISQNELKMSLLSPDGEEGYPANLSVNLSYSLSENNRLIIRAEAKTDKATPVNLSHHSYFNLNGHNKEDISDHHFQINADSFTPINEELIPTGKIRPVDDSPMDFRQAKTIRQEAENQYEQIQKAGGYDHNFVLNKTHGEEISFAAEAFSQKSGRLVKLFTNQFGMQFYTGNFLDGNDTGKANAVYRKRSGFCFEAQNFPDAVNHAGFPTPVLLPGEIYKFISIYEFNTR